MRKLDPKVRNWKAGRLRVIAVVWVADEVEVNEEGSALLRLERRFLYEKYAVPFGEGFALLKPSTNKPDAWEYEDPKALLEFDVRDGRPQCVAVRPAPNGPELTTAILRRLNLDTQVREYTRELTVRLELDERGRVIGVPVFSPRDPWDARSVADVEAELGTAIRRPGRPPISTAELKRVAEVVTEAENARQPTAVAVAEEFHLSIDAAKKRIKKARKDGLLAPAKPRKTRG